MKKFTRASAMDRRTPDDQRSRAHVKVERERLVLGRDLSDFEKEKADRVLFKNLKERSSQLL